MRIRSKLVLIVAASILLTAGPGAVLIYQYAQLNLIETESAELLKSTVVSSSLAMQRFAQGQEKLASLAYVLETDLAKPDQTMALRAFHATLELNPDGIWRNRRAGYDGRRESGIFLPDRAADGSQTGDWQKVLHLRIKQVMDKFGAAANRPQENIWYLSPDRSEIIFDRALPEFVFEMKPDTDYTRTPWLAETSPRLNPDRGVRFTPALFDPVPKRWMVSAVYPLYFKGRWLGSLGEDMPLTATLQSLFIEGSTVKGTQHFLLNQHGNLILAGPWQAQLESSPDAFKLDLDREQPLRELLKTRLGTTPRLLSKQVLVQGTPYLAIGLQLEPLHWRYYSLTPVDAIIAPSRTLFLAAVGIIALTTILAGLMMGLSVNSAISRRIKLLGQTMSGYSSDRSLRASTKLAGNDEIADLARVYDQLADSVKQSDRRRVAAEADLRKSEELWRFALEGSGDGVWDWNIADETTAITRRWKEILGFKDHELPDALTDWDARVHPDDKPHTDAALRACLEGRTSVYFNELRLLAKDGNYRWILDRGMVTSRDPDGNPLRMIGTHHDITARKQSEQWLQHYSSTLTLIAAEQPTGVVLSSIAAFVEQQGEGMLCSILKLTRDRKRLELGAAPSLPDVFNEAINGIEIGPDVGSCGAAAFFGRMVISGDLKTDANWAPWRDLAEKAGLGACWSVPILSSGQEVLGTFGIYRSKSSLPNAEELELFRKSAELAALAIERAQLLEGMRLARVVFENSLDGIMVTDTSHRVLMANQAFQAVTGYQPADVVGKCAEILEIGPGELSFAETLGKRLDGRDTWHGELRGRKKSGDVFPMAVSVATVYDASGSPSHLINVISDIGEQKIQAARIEQLAFYDSLTGLPNRALFLDRLGQTLAASSRNGGCGAILFLDLDRFKEINDSLGHAVGDIALKEVARRLQQVARREETLARLGGDEFVLIADNADHLVAARIAVRMQDALAAPLDLMGQAYTVGASIGIAFYPQDAQGLEDLIKRTDIAMYRAKANGGGFCMYQAEMGDALEKRLQIGQRLAHALESNELQLYYQPQFALKSSEVIGAEALLRWDDPVLGWVGPAEFVPIAEERGMMGALGDWVVSEACRQLNAWARSGLKFNGRLAINVSAVQFEDPDFVIRISAIIADAGLKPNQFELELTESSMMANPDRATAVMDRLSMAGFNLSIDDFGTGYSSLSYLKRFAADQIKIDISFVRDMLKNTDDLAIVTAIIAMARSLDLKTTAEGIEEAGQAQALLALGCDFAQGYLFGRPEPAQTFSKQWLSAAIPN